MYRGSPLSRHGRSGLDAVAMAYAREVFICNEAKLQGLSHSLITTFHHASSSFVDKVNSAPCTAREGYHVPATECPPVLVSAEDHGGCPQSATCGPHPAVLPLPPAAPPAAGSTLLGEQVHSHLLRSVGDHCQPALSRYLDYIRDCVFQSPSQAQLGGVPGTFQLVRSFLHLRQVASTPGLEVSGLVVLAFPVVALLCRMAVWRGSQCGLWCSSACGVETWTMHSTPSHVHSELSSLVSLRSGVCVSLSDHVWSLLDT